MYDPIVGLILASPKPALLYQLKNVYIKISHLISITPITLVQSNESNRYHMDHNICTVGAPKL